jgi:hypothetical protein
MIANAILRHPKLKLLTFPSLSIEKPNQNPAAREIRQETGQVS